ncbi:MAG: CapA family protein [Acidobacteriota bacterium]|nr:CapA family protein [Acidobacteriota bacterium]
MTEQHSQPDGRRPGTSGARRRRRWRKVSLLALVALAVVLVAALASRAPMAFPGRAQGERPQRMPRVLVSDVQAADEPQEQPAAQPAETVTVRLMMVGDILMHSSVIDSGRQADGSLAYDHLFAPLAADIAEADVAVLNQETILGGSSWPYTGYPTFNSPQEVGDAEAAAGFDVILKATNHTLDLGYDGVRAELAYWASAHPEVAVIGMADPDGDGICPAGGTSPAGAYVYEKDGLRIALLNYTDVLNGNVDPAHDGRVVSVMSEEGVRADVAAARERADIVVVFAHWGEEYETVPTESERHWADVLCEAGADVVIGGHPHVIQPVEVLGEGDDRMLVCWSVGNFVSTQLGAANMVGGMVRIDFVKDARGARVGEYAFIPTVTQREGGTAGITAYKLADYTDELAARSPISSIDGGNGATAAWYADYCAQVLGDAFDRETASVHGSL